ncbi:MAG: MerR family DNA-binding protein [Calditrichaeota bacterium]|nr:MerR family DNA-binding protein [Calditrichota bacterium]
MSLLSRSQLAEKVNVNIETLRYYERRGLIPEPQRKDSGYRQYSPDYVVRVHFIQKAKALGFTLNEIQELLSLRVNSQTSCDQVRERAELKLAEMDKKIADLQKMKNALQTLTASCHSDGPTGECPILEALESEGFTL